MKLSDLKPPSREKSDGSTLHDCHRCRGKSKLEVSRSRGVWFCHKCGEGGFFGRTGATWYSVMDDCPDFLPIGPRHPFWKAVRKMKKLSDKQMEQIRPHRGPGLFLWIPFYSSQAEDSEPIYFVGRSVTGRGYRYPNTSWFPTPRNSLLWGIQKIRRKAKRIVLVEGIFDCLWGPNRVAVGGTHVSKWQKEVLQNLTPTEVVIMFDGDATGKAWEAARSLQGGFPSLRVAELPYWSDPDDLRERSEGYVESSWLV